eukprot:CAMPEP_0113584258 /NCGR_PEP_ID=MMETSP0015_2-20120614/33001_1 /TAXON_ID=2838 /ORGANISM="Odontella" /LENGTH=92 /DNA_ID=CAMNT_0000489283 /DNA_START=175 /DNA_END=450 /DNA_ORIENTATION=+ /assembly_acc=CAM_ASM_000160
MALGKSGASWQQYWGLTSRGLSPTFPSKLATYWTRCLTSRLVLARGRRSVDGRLLLMEVFIVVLLLFAEVLFLPGRRRLSLYQLFCRVTAVW